MNARDYQIRTIYKDNIQIGFIARRSLIKGCIQGINDGWICTMSIKSPTWFGNYATR